MLGLALAVLASCTTLYRNHGYAPLPADLALIEPGVTSREEVATLIGRPSSSGVLSDSGWYYVQSRWEHYAWKAPREIERQVVAVQFSEGGTVSDVERFGLQDGKVVSLQRRVTESNIKGLSVIKQLLGNLGRISADQVTN